MKSVLFILPSDLTGGAEQNMLKVARHLTTNNSWKVKVIILSNRANSPSIWCDLYGVEIVKFNSTRESVGALRCFFYLLKSKRHTYDYSFTSHTHCNAFISVLSRLKIVGVNKIIMRESTNVFSWFSGFKLKMMKFFYSLYASEGVVICQTEKMKTELLCNVPRLRNKDVRVVFNPVDLPTIKVLADEFDPFLDVRKPSKIILVAVGRLVEEKSFDYLLKSVAMLPDNFFLFIVGDGPLKNSLSSLADSLGIRERVDFLGALKNPFPYMKHCDIGIVSSSLEGFPNVLLEMMSLCDVTVSTLCADGIENLPGIIKCPIKNEEEMSKSILYGSLMSAEEKEICKAKMRHCVSSLDIETFVKRAFDT